MRPTAVAVTVLALSGCGAHDAVGGPAPAAPVRITLTSPAFAEGATIPARFTCDGADVAPPLRWAHVPPGTRELALVVEDLDAPGGTFLHWVRAGIPADARSTPSAGVDGDNSFGRPGYSGPCPPKGDPPHRYRFEVYALGTRSRLEAGAPPEAGRHAIARAGPLARGMLEGRYGR